MGPKAILQEVTLLHDISDRLHSMADHHPILTDGLIRISGSVRNTATLLEILVATKIGPLPESGSAND